ncbi:DUF2089 domain-containing protein [Ornithinibacillus bavariensis]|uniref:DUF2089 domain-containing protein n=1 Tax=Ornithinibacillus bavariensis TaxID=545502 RepID=A0A919X6G2_9BACI|nr:DUF2089 domain-containing protein [Ornithinibacillus bavariensis]GIO26629.1 hypothetical protein J43TS3_12400 [Ornithinibacillus bavariensis]
MTHPVLTNCPICQHHLTVIQLQCDHCNTVIENKFSLPKFALLTQEQLEFIEIFLVSRGNIKEVEKELGISYPTVRGKLNEVIKALGHDSEQKKAMDESKIVSMLEKGEITPDEAIKLLKE